MVASVTALEICVWRFKNALQSANIAFYRILIIIRWKFKSCRKRLIPVGIPVWRGSANTKRAAGAEDVEERRLMPRLHLSVGLIKRTSFTFNEFFCSTLVFPSSSSRLFRPVFSLSRYPSTLTSSVFHPYSQPS